MQKLQFWVSLIFLVSESVALNSETAHGVPAIGFATVSQREGHPAGVAFKLRWSKPPSLNIPNGVRVTVYQKNVPEGWAQIGLHDMLPNGQRVWLDGWVKLHNLKDYATLPQSAAAQVPQPAAPQQTGGSMSSNTQLPQMTSKKRRREATNKTFYIK